MEKLLPPAARVPIVSDKPVARDLRTIADVSLVRSVFAPRAQVDEHEHAVGFFCLATEGSHFERVHGTTLHRHQGSVVFHPARETHADSWGEQGGSCLNVELGGLWQSRLDAMRVHPGQFREWKGGQVTSWASRIDHIVRRPSPPAAADSIEVEGLVLLMLAEVMRTGRRAERSTRGAWVERLREFLHDEFRTAHTLDAIAVAFGVHPATLARAFRREYGVSVGEYVRLRRVQEASRLIANTDRPIGAIAHELGYADHSHCVREFRRVMGCAPSDFRRSSRREPRAADASKVRA
jgi:AraC family transcriptional regulator